MTWNNFSFPLLSDSEKFARVVCCGRREWKKLPKASTRVKVETYF